MIDPRAVVSSTAQLAADVEVGPFAVVGPNVVIGPGSRIGPHAVVDGHTTIGRDCQVFQFASIGDAPQDKKYKGEPTRLEIGDRCVFREYCTVNRGTTHDEGVTRIGNDNWFMAYTHVAHDCKVGNNVVMSNCATLGGHVVVGDFVIFAGFAAAHQFCHIGPHAFIGNNAAVTKDVPPYLMVTGQPARPNGINSEGLKRRGFSADQIANVKAAYKVLYRSGRLLSEATEELTRLAATQPEVQPFLDLLASSTRSIIR